MSTPLTDSGGGAGGGVANKDLPAPKPATPNNITKVDITKVILNHESPPKSDKTPEDRPKKISFSLASAPNGGETVKRNQISPCCEGCGNTGDSDGALTSDYSSESSQRKKNWSEEEESDDEKPTCGSEEELLRDCENHLPKQQQRSASSRSRGGRIARPSQMFTTSSEPHLLDEAEMSPRHLVTYVTSSLDTIPLEMCQDIPDVLL